MPLGVEGEWLNCLKLGRQRLGFTLKHVQSLATESASSPGSPWSKIIQTPFMLALAKELKVDGTEALHRYVAAVIKRLPNRRQLVASWALNLNLDAPFCTQQLGDRRAEIAKQLSIPSVASYRSREEGPTLGELVKALNEPRSEDIRALGLPEETVAKLIPPERRTTSKVRGKVTVVGAAVMDLNFVIPHLPEPGESVQALSFETSPGGKGLCQAVACARLGLDTTLISVVGDDIYGTRILDYLKQQNVSVDLIEIRRNAKTAVTAVLTRRKTGGSSAIGWKNTDQLQFSPDLLDAPGFCEQIGQSDFLLCSFELPKFVVSKALVLAKAGDATTIVAPAPPFHEVLVGSDVKSNIDYIVANRWELSCLTSTSEPLDETGLENIESMAAELMINDAVRNVIVTHNSICHAFLQGATADGHTVKLAVSGYSSRSESAGERDAFCAMLARQLVDCAGDTKRIANAIHWATAAMGSLRTETSVPESMPTYDQVARRMATQALPEEPKDNLINVKETFDE